MGVSQALNFSFNLEEGGMESFKEAVTEKNSGDFNRRRWDRIMAIALLAILFFTMIALWYNIHVAEAQEEPVLAELSSKDFAEKFVRDFQELFAPYGPEFRKVLLIEIFIGIFPMVILILFIKKSRRLKKIPEFYDGHNWEDVGKEREKILAKKVLNFTRKTAAVIIIFLLTSLSYVSHSLAGSAIIESEYTDQAELAVIDKYYGTLTFPPKGKPYILGMRKGKYEEFLITHLPEVIRKIKKELLIDKEVIFTPSGSIVKIWGFMDPEEIDLAIASRFKE